MKTKDLNELLIKALMKTLPPVPTGFNHWVWRGHKYKSPRAIIVTSIDPYMDGSWDPPAMFQTDGQENTLYAEAVIDHHSICHCEECAAKNYPTENK